MQQTDSLDFRSYRDVTESHAHDFWQVVLPVRGELHMDIGGQGGAVHPGQGALIPAGVRHAFSAQGRNAFLVADVQSLPLPEPAADRFSGSGFFPISPAVRALMDYRAATPDAVGAAATAHWCALLLQAISARPERSDPLEAGVEKAVAYMRHHLAGPVRIADLAEASGLAAHRLNAAFQARYRTSPYAHLGQMRLAEALRLLEDTRLPLGEIAYRCGFPDQSALSRALRRHRGASPAAYRRAMASGIA